MPEDVKDVFVVHSKREAVEGALALRLIEWLSLTGISVYEYADWQWSRPESLVEYSAGSGSLDPIRFAMRDPKPFRRRTRTEVPDKDSLLELLDKCRVVLLIAPRSGSPSEGVGIELDVLPQGATILAVSWGEQNDWLVERHRPGYVYRIKGIYDAGQKAAADDVARLVWLHWSLDYLIHRCGDAGVALVRDVSHRDPAISRILGVSSRFTRAVSDKSITGVPPNAPGTGAVVHFWYGRAALRKLLPAASDEVQRLEDIVAAAVDEFCEAALHHNSQLVDDKAQGLRLLSALCDALQGAREEALLHYDEALQLPGLSDCARSEVLADRAAKTLTSSPGAALADIEPLLGLTEASSAAKSQALWLRGRLDMRRRRTEAAVSDFSAALEVPSIAPILRALCLHERAAARQMTGDSAGALTDLIAATSIKELPAEVAAPAHLDCAVLYGEAGDIDSELSHYDRVIDLPNTPDETRLKAHMYRGLAFVSRGDRLSAIHDFVTVRDDPASPGEAKAAAERRLAKLDPLRESAISAKRSKSSPAG